MNCLLLESVIALLLLKCVRTSLLNKEKGAECKVVEDEVWTCQSIDECPQVGDFKRSRPKICSFVGKEPIICCPPNSGAFKEPSDVRLPISDDKNKNLPSNHEDMIEVDPPDSSIHPSKIPVSMKKCIQNEVSLCQNKFTSSKDYTTRLVRQAHFHHVVLGGTPAALKQFPFMALIGYGEVGEVTWDCGGSIISEKWVLSAAHCSESRTGKAKWVVVGIVEVDNENLENLRIRINRIVIHPNYKTPAMYNDIALFELKTTLLFNQFVKPVCLTPLNLLPPNATAAGWGTTEFGGQKSTSLLSVDMSIVDTASCRRFYETSRLIPKGVDDERMLCAGDYKKDTCTGDSGGPLFYKSSICLHIQAGIVSFGRRCGILPGVYTKTSYYLPWIESIVWPDEEGIDIPDYPVPTTQHQNQNSNSFNKNDHVYFI